MAGVTACLPFTSACVLLRLGAATFYPGAAEPSWGRRRGVSGAGGCVHRIFWQEASAYSERLRRALGFLRAVSHAFCCLPFRPVLPLQTRAASSRLYAAYERDVLGVGLAHFKRYEHLLFCCLQRLRCGPAPPSALHCGGRRRVALPAAALLAVGDSGRAANCAYIHSGGRIRQAAFRRPCGGRLLTSVH